MDNPYKVLGIDEGASDSDIKAAYRRLAMKHHPDKAMGDPSAEEKFKEINSAYELIKDAAARERFHGKIESSFSGFSSQFDDIISRSYRWQPVRKNENIEAYHTITLEEAFNGTDVHIMYKDVSLHVKIPAGVDTGSRIRVPGKGDHTHADLPAGDIFIHIVIEPHSTFTRHGPHLFRDLYVDTIDAMLGEKAKVVGIDGKEYDVEIPAGVVTGWKINVSGKGMPVLGSTYYGDVVVNVVLVNPKDITDEQRELLLKFKQLSK